MKKAMGRVLALFLAACMLCGCSLIGEEYTDFQDIVYERPELDVLLDAVEQVELLLEEDAPVRRILPLLDICYAEYGNFATMQSYSEIRFYQDMRDPFYEQEYAWCQGTYPLVLQAFEELYALCGSSSRAEELEEQYFWEGFAREYAEPGDVFYDEELTALYSREAELLAEYRALTAEPSILVDGEEVDLYEYMLWADDREMAAAEKQYYDRYTPLMAELYRELVLLRQEQALAAGFDSYEQMQFAAVLEKDYDREKADAYVNRVREELVPLYREAAAEGLLDVWPEDYIREDELHALLAQATAAMGAAFEEAFDYMSDYHYYDIAAREGKAGGAFQNYLPDYESPFLFLSPAEDESDVLSFAHELGHYVDSYVNGDMYENMDASECFSQSMEYLVLCYLEEGERFWPLKLRDSLDLYVQQTSFHAFEQQVYRAAPEELSESFFNELSLQLAEDYGYCQAGQEDYYARSWWEIPHFFEQPFYVISYPLANDLALQILEAELQEEGAGLALFETMLQNPHENLSQILEATGLESPFAEGAFSRRAEFLKRLLAA